MELGGLAPSVVFTGGVEVKLEAVNAQVTKVCSCVSLGVFSAAYTREK